MLQFRLGALVLLAGTAMLNAGEPCVSQICQDSRCCPEESCCETSCCLKKPCRFQICIPSIRFGFSVDCCRDSGCGSCCLSCCRKEPRWYEPPRAPLAFSVPAVTVAQQAVAVNPVFPVPRAECRADSQAASEMERLIVEAMLKRMEANEAKSQTAPAPAAQSGTEKSTEERLAELEERLDRILNALEQ